MAGKRKAKRAEREDLSKPSRWRLQHGGFGEPVREADPETGTPVQYRRAVVAARESMRVDSGHVEKVREPRGSPATLRDDCASGSRAAGSFLRPAYAVGGSAQLR
jgi:hypothetical protein